MDEILNVTDNASLSSSMREALKKIDSVKISELAAIIAERALDNFEYEGKTLREWVLLVSSGNLVEVVLCKNCMFRNTAGCPYMRINAVPREDFDFCSDGEKANGGADYGI